MSSEKGGSSSSSTVAHTHDTVRYSASQGSSSSGTFRHSATTSADAKAAAEDGYREFASAQALSAPHDDSSQSTLVDAHLSSDSARVADDTWQELTTQDTTVKSASAVTDSAVAHWTKLAADTLRKFTAMQADCHRAAVEMHGMIQTFCASGAEAPNDPLSQCKQQLASLSIDDLMHRDAFYAMRQCCQNGREFVSSAKWTEQMMDRHGGRDGVERTLRDLVADKMIEVSRKRDRAETLHEMLEYYQAQRSVAVRATSRLDTGHRQSSNPQADATSARLSHTEDKTKVHERIQGLLLTFPKWVLNYDLSKKDLETVAKTWVSSDDHDRMVNKKDLETVAKTWVSGNNHDQMVNTLHRTHSRLCREMATEHPTDAAITKQIIRDLRGILGSVIALPPAAHVATSDSEGVASNDTGKGTGKGKGKVFFISRF